jgi:hypothetical protein
MTDMFGLPIKIGDTVLSRIRYENPIRTVAAISSIGGKEVAILSSNSDTTYYGHHTPAELISLEPYKLLYPELFI